MPTIERIADTHNHTGEGPLWHPDEERLYWVDIPAGTLYRFYPEESSHEVAYETPDGSPIGGFTIEADGSLLLFGGAGWVGRWDPDAGGEAEAETVVDLETPTRFNDVIADPAGRVFCGTMPGEELGDLYRIDTDDTVECVIADVDISNGMGFSPDLETFYFTESKAHTIYAYDYDEATGEITNGRPFVETDPDGVPDGMTVDEEGYIWSARWGGGRAVRYDTNGDPVAEIDFPARKVSCVTFGGSDYGHLYATTALGSDDATRETEGDGAGALFRVPDPGVAGRPEFRSTVTTE